MVEAMDVENQNSDTKIVGSDAEQDVKVQEDSIGVETVGVGTENHKHACEGSELLGHHRGAFVGSDGGEVLKVNSNVSNQISTTVASDKVFHSSGNEDQLAKSSAYEDDSSVGQDMYVEEQVTGAEQDGLDQVQEMEVEEHDTDSEQPTNIDEKAVKRTALNSASAVKVHQAKYRLMSEEEGEFSVSAISNSFSQIEKQSNSESFQNAVNYALEEVSRMAELGLACSCMPQDAYDKINFQKVENTGVQQESSIRDGVDMSLSASSFEPDKLVDYMKALAESTFGGGDRLDLVIAKAQLFAFYRLKGYHQLPEFQFCGGLSENEASTSHSEENMYFGEEIEHTTPMCWEIAELSLKNYPRSNPINRIKKERNQAHPQEHKNLRGLVF
ncbi:Tudor/PWWP/MBT superfamily protein [Theobroma cacao]|uniref:Tudor/PWWP/MBT superfamily protein n=1 Tax=Theobroma cacao TaxID=3641 RepID=A0A061E4B4_THECC|nr:Tudor/PWWP/MBT superfamily protein [Theobroma cacao]